MLRIIDKSLAALLLQAIKELTDIERMALFLCEAAMEFTRKDYIQKFTELSSATASRDLKKAFDDGLLEKFGDKKTTYYRQLRA